MKTGAYLHCVKESAQPKTYLESAHSIYVVDDRNRLKRLSLKTSYYIYKTQKADIYIKGNVC
jgi:hypothetical protein